MSPNGTRVLVSRAPINTPCDAHQEEACATSASVTLEETDMDVGGLADRAMKRGGTTEPNHIICQVVLTILSRDQLHKNEN